MNDEYFIKIALDLAKQGAGFTSPNPMVGAVVVKDNKIVGKGFHEAVGKAHAEVNAINDAGIFANGATLYVTLEPCNHTGRTPPCTKKIVSSGIKRVVVAMGDPNPHVQGGGIDSLIDLGIEVTAGICENEAKKQNEIFLKYINTKRPFVIVKCAATLDGQIATKTGDSKWVTSEESRKYVHGLRHLYDAIMVGIDTVKTDDPSLTTRLDGINCLDPVRVILDTHLSISEDAKILGIDSSSETIIITGDSFSKDKKKRIEKKGATVVNLPVKNGFIDLKHLIGYLGSINITSLLIEGGGKVIASAFQAKIVDKINFFYGPKILGGNNGKSICNGLGPALMKNSIQIRDIDVTLFGNDVLVEGYVINNSFENTEICLCSQE